MRDMGTLFVYRISKEFAGCFTSLEWLHQIGKANFAAFMIEI
jgi:hypothetical protein